MLGPPPLAMRPSVLPLAGPCKRRSDDATSVRSPCHAKAGPGRPPVDRRAPTRRMPHLPLTADLTPGSDADMSDDSRKNLRERGLKIRREVLGDKYVDA